MEILGFAHHKPCYDWPCEVADLPVNYARWCAYDLDHAKASVRA